MSNVKNQVVLVTGATGGIGAATVKEFLDNGAKHVIGLDINGERCNLLEKEFKNKYGQNRVKYIKCDLTRDLEAVYKKVLKDYGYIDILVNNAGIINETTKNVGRTVGVNFMAVLQGTLLAYDSMGKDKSGHGGTVINIASLAALVTFPSLPIYSGTKSGLVKFSNCLGSSFHFNNSGVRIITICFGATETSIMAQGASLFTSQEIYDSLVNIGEMMPRQSSEDAAKAIMDVYKKAGSGSTWAVVEGKSEDFSEILEEGQNLVQAALVNLFSSNL